MFELRRGVNKNLILVLVASSGISLSLYIARSIESSSARYSFLIWNLFLGWLPLVIVWWLKYRLQFSSWLSLRNLFLTSIWLGFLPNSFYLVSDLIHLRPTGEVSVLYDAVMFASFIFNAYIIGFISLYFIHLELLKRIRARDAHIIIAIVVLGCSFAIYLGRYLRWNTWDLLVNPAGILFDVSDRLVNPAAHPQAFATTATFFVFIGSVYFVIWNIVLALKNQK